MAVFVSQNKLLHTKTCPVTSFTQGLANQIFSPEEANCISVAGQVDPNTNSQKEAVDSKTEEFPGLLPLTFKFIPQDKKAGEKTRNSTKNVSDHTYSCVFMLEPS